VLATLIIDVVQPKTGPEPKEAGEPNKEGDTGLGASAKPLALAEEEAAPLEETKPPREKTPPPLAGSSRGNDDSAVGHFATDPDWCRQVCPRQDVHLLWVLIDVTQPCVS
jgi:hypothetical protein